MLDLAAPDRLAGFLDAQVDGATLARLERFLSTEALLLDLRRFDAWLELLDPDLTYTMATVVNGHARNPRNQPEPTYLFCDSKRQIEQRIARLGTGIAWSEEPASRTRRCVSNVLAAPDGAGGYRVLSNFVLFRSRQESDNTILMGARDDRLRPAGDSFVIASRTITLDQATLQSHNLSFFL